MARYWYAYNGIGNPFSPSSYQRPNVRFAPLCTVGLEICAIYALGSSSSLAPNNPFSVNFQTYIASALIGSGLPKPDSAKYYVYLKFSKGN